MPLHRDAIFRPFELRLQFRKILRRPELRITLRHRQHPDHRTVQLVLRLLKLLQLGRVGRGNIRAHPRVLRRRPGPGDFLERRLLEIGRTLHGRNQIRNQIRSPLVNVLNLRRLAIHPLASWSDGYTPR